jgi:hypothetical protein
MRVPLSGDVVAVLLDVQNKFWTPEPLGVQNWKHCFDNRCYQASVAWVKCKYCRVGIAQRNPPFGI